MASGGLRIRRELLDRFGPDLIPPLTRALARGSLTEVHVLELIRLTSSVPSYRDAEEFESLLEDAEEMESSAFKVWVDRLLQDEKDQ